MNTRRSPKKAPTQQWPFVRFSEREKAWLVDARTKDGGSRRFFPTRIEAETFAAQCRIRRGNEGTAAFGNVELARYGKTVQDAVSFYLAHLRQLEKSIPLADAIAELVELRRAAGKSHRYCRDLKTRLARFAKDYPGASVADFDSKTIDGWLAGLPVAPGTRNTFRERIRTLFSLCVKRGYCTTNPASETEAAKLVDAPVEILSVSEAARLLAESGPDTIAFNAISLFAGLRAAEVQKLDWRHVHLDSGLIEVSAASAKTRKRRLVKIEPNLIEWLIPVAQIAGPVTPIGIRRRLEAVRGRAGFGAGKPWPQNCMRHSFGSYWLAKHQDAAALSLQMGNSPQMIFQHYREVVKPESAARYWAIKPMTAGKVVSIASSAA